MKNILVRKWLTTSLTIGLCLAKTAISSKAEFIEPTESVKKQHFISLLKRPDKEMQNVRGESMRDIYVAKISELDSSVLDPETLNLFSDLIDNDENVWVRLEAVADIANFPMSEDMVPKVTGLLEKYRNDERVNFQVFASQSLLRIGHKHGKLNMQAEKTLAKIAQGQDLEKWKVMIPTHNVGTMIMDPGSKSQIPFEDFYKVNMRVKALLALTLSKDDFSKKVISDLAKDSNTWVRETAQSYSAAH